MRSRRLTIYLLREDVADFEDGLDPEKTSTSIELASSSGVDGRFHYLSPSSSAPSWVSFVQPLLPAPVSNIRTSSAYGLLLLRSSGRIFAITFGFGRSLLDLSKIEYQFGLRVALNRIDPSQIRSLDTRTFEDMVKTTNTQVSKDAELPAFGVDVSTDILRAVTGTPRDTSFAKRISGADAVVLNVQTEPQDLPALCAGLLTAFNEEAYKADFGWIDQLEQVRSDALITRLNDAVVSDLRRGDISNTHLAMPEAIGWEDIDAFKIAGTRGVEYDDLDLGDYLRDLSDDREDITVELLKSRAVSVRFARSDRFDRRWTLHLCLVSEQRIDGMLQVLLEGRWFAVNESLVQEVDAYVDQLPEPGSALLPASAGEVEKDYNTRVASGAPDGFLNLDAKIKRPGGAASGIELCDLLSSAGELIHVKRKSRSSTLSHLFAQGSVSATAFIGDGTFRDELRSVVEQITPKETREVWLELIPAGSAPVNRSRYRVVYAVVTNSSTTGRGWLPFFSKLNLMQQARQLRTLGFDVALLRIPIAAAL